MSENNSELQGLNGAAVAHNGDAVPQNGVVAREPEQSFSQKDIYRVRKEIREQQSVNAIKISPSKQTFATCSSDGIIRIYNMASGELSTELRGHTGGISDVDFSPVDSDILASASDDLTIRLWCISKQKCLKILKKHTYHVTCIRFTTKGNILISGSADETITIWDLSSGKNLKTLAAHSDPISSISITPDNSLVVSGSYDGLMRLFDTESGQCLKTLVFNSSSYGTATASTSDVVNFPISYVQCSPNGKYILSTSLDGAIRLWDYMNNKVIKTYSGDGPVCEKFNCGSRFILSTAVPLIVSGSDHGVLYFWDVQTKEIINRMKFEDSPIFEVDECDGGDTLVCCNAAGVIRLLERISDGRQ